MSNKKQETNSLSNVAKKVLEYQKDEELFTKPSELVLTKDYRCKRCIERNSRECIIQVGIKRQKQVYCKSCRQETKSLYNCKPNIKILQETFPNHPQINYTKDLLETYDQQINENGSKIKHYFTHFPRKSLKTSEGMTSSSKNQLIDKSSQVNSACSPTNMFVDVSSQSSSSAVKSPSTVFSNPSSSPTVNDCSYEHNFAQPSLSSSIPTLSTPIRSPLYFPMQMVQQPQPSSSSHIQMQSNHTIETPQFTFSQLSNHQNKQDSEKMNSSLLNRMKDIEEMLENQTRTIMKGIKRDLQRDQDE